MEAAATTSATTLGIDCRFAGASSGLGRFTRELTLALIRRNDPWNTVLFVRSTNEPWLRDIAPGARVTIRKTDIPYYSLPEQVQWPFSLRRAKIDLLLVPHFNVPCFSSIPFVTIIHDLILHRYPGDAPLFKRLAYRFLFRHAVRRSRAVLTVSQFTARELVDLYGREILPRITTTYEGVSPIFTPRPELEQQRIRGKYGLLKPFFLYVGTVKPHKNVQTLIDAFHSLHTTDTELILAAGGKEIRGLTFAPNVRILPQIPDEDLPALYSAALAFVTASLYEGFCLPLVEARACGCPVIAAHVAAIPEVADSGCILVRPRVDELAIAMKNPPRHRPPDRAWRWDDTAARVASVLMSSLVG